MYVIGIYDINTEDSHGQKRLQKVFKIFKKYLIHIQKSVFEGEITKAKLEKLKIELKQIINKQKDSVIFFKSREQRWLSKELLGLTIDKTDNFI